MRNKVRKVKIKKCVFCEFIEHIKVVKCGKIDKNCKNGHFRDFEAVDEFFPEKFVQHSCLSIQ